MVVARGAEEQRREDQTTACGGRRIDLTTLAVHALAHASIRARDELWRARVPTRPSALDYATPPARETTSDARPQERSAGPPCHFSISKSYLGPSGTVVWPRQGFRFFTPQISIRIFRAGAANFDEISTGCRRLHTSQISMKFRCSGQASSPPVPPKS
jgi:hypothetical protein